MFPIKNYKNDIEYLCKKHKVKRLYIFGSALTEEFNGKSDVDLIVDFDSIDLNSYADNYFDLKYSLQNIFHRTIDLLEEQAIKNPYFKKVVTDQRQLVYGH